MAVIVGAAGFWSLRLKDLLPVIAAVVAVAGAWSAAIYSRRTEHQKWLRQERLAVWARFAATAQETISFPLETLEAAEILEDMPVKDDEDEFLATARHSARDFIVDQRPKRRELIGRAEAEWYQVLLLGPERIDEYANTLMRAMGELLGDGREGSREEVAVLSGEFAGACRMLLGGQHR